MQVFAFVEDSNFFDRHHHALPDRIADKMNDPFDVFGSTFPRSPKSENIFGSQDMSDLSGIFTLKSPLSVLATDMDANFTIRSGG